MITQLSSIFNFNSIQMHWITGVSFSACGRQKCPPTSIFSPSTFSCAFSNFLDHNTNHWRTWYSFLGQCCVYSHYQSAVDWCRPRSWQSLTRNIRSSPDWALYCNFVRLYRCCVLVLSATHWYLLGSVNTEDSVQDTGHFIPRRAGKSTFPTRRLPQQRP